MCNHRPTLTDTQPNHVNVSIHDLFVLHVSGATGQPQLPDELHTGTQG